MRERKAELKRVGWFGTPAGLIDLRAVKMAEPIETITRGGDIEFDLKSIDRTLTAFDLLLLPVEHNKWNLAKNANRMVKAVALGVPVLATATPAHIATVEALGLDDRFLVREGENWDAKIAGLRRDFSAVQDAILRARGRAIELFAMHRIGGDWLQHIERALDAKTAAAQPPKSTDEALEDVALVTLAYRSANLPSSAADGAVPSAASTAQSRLRHPSDYLELFDALWEAVASVEQDWVLFKPEGFTPRRPLRVEFRRAMSKRAFRACHAFNSRCGASSVAFPPTSGPHTPRICAERCASRAIPGMCLVRRSWLVQQPWRAGDALAIGLGFCWCRRSVKELPVSFATPLVLRDNDPAITNICCRICELGDA